MPRKRPRIYPRTTERGERRYDVSLDYYDPATGQRRQRMRTFATEVDARRCLAQHESQGRQQDSPPPGRLTFGAVAEQWLTAHRPHIRPTTAYLYARLLKRHILPHLGQVALQDCTLATLEAFYGALREQGVGAAVIRNVHQRCVQILRWASTSDLPVKGSALRTRTPTYHPRRMTCWDDAEIARFLDTTSNPALAPFWRTAVYTGLRRGELCALRWEDVDWDAHILHVQRSVTRIAGGHIWGATKNGRDRRVSIPASLLGVLRAHRTAQLERRVKSNGPWAHPDLVFTNAAGQVLAGETLQRDLNRICALAGLGKVRIHDLRHSHASVLFRHGKSVSEVAERLGHQNATQTLNVYSHVIPDQHRATAQMLGDLFG